MRNESTSKPTTNGTSRDAISPDVGKAKDKDQKRFIASTYRSADYDETNWVCDCPLTSKTDAIREALGSACSGYHAIVIDSFTDTIILTLEPTDEE